MRRKFVFEIFRLLVIFAAALPTAVSGEVEGNTAIAQLASLTVAPRMEAAEGFPQDGNIKSIYFDGLMWKEKPTKVFALMGVPDGRGKPVPGVVLIHGGGGTAFREWVEKWNEKGFAAIAIAVEGQTSEPGQENGRWKSHEWAGPARDGIYGDSAAPLEDQWMYHAVADTILANSLLRAQPGVDAERIGVMGISWGGVITSTVMGIDSRFAFAIPVYGCGGLSGAENQYGRALGGNTVYQKLWDPLLRLGNAKLPTLWFSWPGDQHFPLDCQAASYRAAPGLRTVALVPGMNHGHGPPWNRPESYAFARSVVEDGAPWCRSSDVDSKDGAARATFLTMKSPDAAVLVSTTDTGITGSRKWNESPANLASDEAGIWLAAAPLPPGTTAWFINLRCGELVCSSDYQSIAQAPDHYPAFSWDTVPVYKMFGDGGRLLTAGEARGIAASTSFLCIEKNHAANVLGSADLGAKQEFVRFKTLDPAPKCLFYFNSAYAYPFTSRTNNFQFNDVEEPFRSYLIRDSESGGLAARGRVHFFDVLNPEFRNWWADTVGDLVRETGADGLFVDQMHGFSYLRPRSRDEVEAAQAEMMRMAKEKIGKDRILLLNNGAHIPELFEIGDAFMFEHFSTNQLTKEAIVEDWALLKKISDAGKIAVWRIGVEVGNDESARLSDSEYERISKEKLPYHLAVFLMGAQPYSYFQYGWGWRLQNGALVDYPELLDPLGPPLGEMKRIEPKGWVFEREFQDARVVVDLEKRTGMVAR